MRAARKQAGTRGLAFALALVLLASCGKSGKEGNERSEAERKRAEAESNKALASFADHHGALLVDPLQGDSDFRASLRLTAQLQEETEGSIIAFRSSVLDLVRVSSNNYELILGKPFSIGSLVTLSTDLELANKVLADQPHVLSRYFVAARIDRVLPLTLEIEPCSEPDCSEVGLRPNLFHRYHRFVGEAIALESMR